MQAARLSNENAAPRPSSLPKWPLLAAVLGFFGVLLIGNWALERSLSTPSDAPAPGQSAPVEVSIEPSAPRDLPGWSSYFDPTLMVLPNERSYSKVYLNEQPSFSLPGVEVVIPTRPPEFSHPYVRASETVVPTQAGSWSKSEPLPLVAPVEEDSIPASGAGSLASLSGELLNRKVLHWPDFPRVSQNDLLPPSEILVGVDAAGQVKLVLLDKSCGNDSTDTLGLDLARTLSFVGNPAQGEALSWGRLKIAWSVDLPAK
ncbi:MAG: hypothetical protein JO317_03630 [Verrucomicrobiae bacterium]|nr:hypothetical protein [Verrucomicrobiae bacterium]